MKSVLSICVLSLSVGLIAVPRWTLSSARNQSIGDRFAGAWWLVSLEAPGSDGKIHQVTSTGLLVFTRDGHLSVQVLERNPKLQATAGPGQFSQPRTRAYLGSY